MDVEKSDVILVEMTDHYRNYVGTVAEITIARELNRPGKPIVAFVGKERLKDNGEHYSYWLDYLCTKVVATMEEAIIYICEVLDYDNTKDEKTKRYKTRLLQGGGTVSED
jgi:hypothetical protein